MAYHEAATDEQIAERKLIIRNLITSGFTQAQVVKAIQTKYAAWGITDRQIRNYYKACFEDMSTDAGLVDRAAYFIRTLERMDDIYSKAIAVDNLKVAHEVNLGIAKLLRLENPSAAMDWRTAAKQTGLEPAEIVKQLSSLFGKGATDEITQ